MNEGEYSCKFPGAWVLTSRHSSPGGLSFLPKGLVRIGVLLWASNRRLHNNVRRQKGLTVSLKRKPGGGWCQAGHHSPAADVRSGQCAGPASVGFPGVRQACQVSVSPWCVCFRSEVYLSGFSETSRQVGPPSTPNPVPSEGNGIPGQV